jgi:hypothetical protein
MRHAKRFALFYYTQIWLVINICKRVFSVAESARDELRYSLRLAAVKRRCASISTVCTQMCTVFIVISHPQNFTTVCLPKDVSVAGFDDIPLAAMNYPTLTTMRQPINRLGERAAEMRPAVVDGAISPGHRELLPTELVLRGSTACGGCISGRYLALCGCEWLQADAGYELARSTEQEACCGRSE